MPRRRVKTRIDHLVEALEAAQKAGACLSEVNLRTTSGELRDAVRRARDVSADLRRELQRAILADRPQPPHIREPRTSS